MKRPGKFILFIGWGKMKRDKYCSKYAKETARVFLRTETAWLELSSGKYVNVFIQKNTSKTVVAIGLSFDDDIKYYFDRESAEIYFEHGVGEDIKMSIEKIKDLGNFILEFAKICEEEIEDEK